MTNVGSVVTQECKQDFMLVGEGFALDGSAEQTRLGCNLAAVPGFTVAPVVANAYEMYQASPNPANASPVRAPTRPRSSSARRPSRSASTAPPSPPRSPRRTRPSRPSPRPAGSSSPTAPPTSTTTARPNYTPFVQKLQSCGAQIIFNDATPGATLYGAFEAENQIGYDPIWVMDSGAYTAAFAQWNTEGLANNVYVRLSYEPLEAAKVVPAVNQYISIVKKYGGLTSQLGEQATSSFLLWATEAKACGSDPDPPVHDQPPLQGDELDRRRAQRLREPGQEHPAELRSPHEARRDQVGAGLPEEARDVRLLAQVRRAQLGLGHRHHVERPGLRHPVRHLLGPQAPGVSAPNVSPPAA